MQLPWLSVGALLCAVSVVAGAFGAHGLERRLDNEALVRWEVAARYLMYGGFGLLVMGLLSQRGTHKSVDLAAWNLLLGSLIFSTTVAILALGGPRWLGMVTPFGGLLLIVGFVLLAWTGLQL